MRQIWLYNHLMNRSAQNTRSYFESLLFQMKHMQPTLHTTKKMCMKRDGAWRSLRSYGIIPIISYVIVSQQEGKLSSHKMVVSSINQINLAFSRGYELKPILPFLLTAPDTLADVGGR